MRACVCASNEAPKLLAVAFCSRYFCILALDSCVLFGHTHTLKTRTRTYMAAILVVPNQMNCVTYGASILVHFSEPQVAPKGRFRGVRYRCGRNAIRWGLGAQLGDISLKMEI